MANGESCIHCGEQETPHVYGESEIKTCGKFESSEVHDSNCIGSVYGAEIMCNGDCEETKRIVANRHAHNQRERDPSALIAFIGELRRGNKPNPHWYF